jgi:hypothetical protein
MATAHALQLANGPVDVKCSVWKCDEVAVCFASYQVIGGPKGLKVIRRPYCQIHGLMFGAKHKLLECRNGDVFLKARI